MASANSIEASYAAHLRKVTASIYRTSMVGKLLDIMSESLEVSGTDSSLAGMKRQRDLIKSSKGDMFSSSKARFALGGDDGAYLRSNVMPLQTVLRETDERLALKMTDEMRIAGYIGLLNAYNSATEDMLAKKNKALEAVWQTASWVISIPEVGAFTRAHIKQNPPDDACTEAKGFELIRSMEMGEHLADIDDPQVLEALKNIILALLSILKDSMQYAIGTQLKRSVDAVCNKMKSGLRTVVTTAIKEGQINAEFTYTQLLDLYKSRTRTQNNTALAANAAVFQMFGAEQEIHQKDTDMDLLHAYFKNELIIPAYYSGKITPAYLNTLQIPARAHMLSFAMARGLCGRRAAHHRASENPAIDDNLLYTTPMTQCPTMSQLSSVICEDLSEFDNSRVHVHKSVTQVDDFCRFDGEEASVENRWTPINNIKDAKLDDSDEAVCLAECSVLEHLAKYYKDKAASSGGVTQLSYSAHAALTKLFQTQKLAKLYAIDIRDLRNLCPSGGYQTIPIQRTQSETRVKHAFNAGVVQVKASKDKTPSAGPPAASLTDDQRNTLDIVANGFQDADSMFLSRPFDYVGFSGGTTPVIGVQGSFHCFPKSPDHIDALKPSSIAKLLQSGVTMLEDISKLYTEIASTKDAKEKVMASKTSMEGLAAMRNDMARGRREEVWNDAMREAAISGDRLYAFVRQFSGTIHEQVDAVCVLDESMLVQQQKDKQANAKRLSLLASQQHMQLVSNVFRSVISESGLTLGIDDKAGIDGELKVVSNTLRKQVSELASGNGGQGFFSNSVRLENLMAQGTGEMTLTGLFERLRDVGVALQNAAADDSLESVNSDAPSLDYLSSPRNSLLLRYKPEAHAAIRQAYDTFTREMNARHHLQGYYPHRKISAFELIEGRHDELCMAFAAFAAHTLAHQRMFSASHAAYIGQFASRANVAAMHFTLDKLINVACCYVADTERPNFTNPGGWERYFHS